MNLKRRLLFRNDKMLELESKRYNLWNMLKFSKSSTYISRSCRFKGWVIHD